MCFSPTASFAAAAVLTATGSIALAKSETTPHRLLSGIPLLFAVQQFAEGILWLSLMQAEWAAWSTAATYVFLIFAQTLWPVYVPAVILLFEDNVRKKKMLRLLTFAGLLFSLFSLVCLILYPPTATAAQGHIRYDFDYSLPAKWYYGLLYFLPTIVAPLVSTHKSLRWLGGLFLVAYILARAAFHFYVISVWCFFGAVISLYVLYLMVRKGVFSFRQAG